MSSQHNCQAKYAHFHYDCRANLYEKDKLLKILAPCKSCVTASKWL